MKIIKPVTVTDTNLISINIPEVLPAAYVAGTTYALGDIVSIGTDIYASLQDTNLGNAPASSPLFWVLLDAIPAEWLVGTTYALGDIVTVASTHKVYESLQAANTGNSPPLTTGGATPYWLELSATNPWKLFDSSIGNGLETKMPFVEISIKAPRLTALSVLGLENATSYKVVYNSILYGEVYNTGEVSLVDNSSLVDWYSYFFSDSSIKNTILLDSIPIYLDGTITITVTKDTSAEYMTVDELVVGEAINLGFTQWTPSVGIIDYSKKEVDEFGNYTILQRAYSKKIDVQIVTETADFNKTLKLLESLRTTPVVWVLTDDSAYEQTLVYGFYKDFSMTIPHPVWSNLSLSIEGLT